MTGDSNANAMYDLINCYVISHWMTGHIEIIIDIKTIFFLYNSLLIFI